MSPLLENVKPLILTSDLTDPNMFMAPIVFRLQHAEQHIAVLNQTPYHSHGTNIFGNRIHVIYRF